MRLLSFAGKAVNSLAENLSQRVFEKYKMRLTGQWLSKYALSFPSDEIMPEFFTRHYFDNSILRACGVNGTVWRIFTLSRHEIHIVR
jgi:hypothetical protein